MAVISFLVSSGLTINDACSIGPYFTVYTNVTDEATQCGGCYSAGLTCWACLNADTPSQTLYLDAGLTQPVYSGLSYLVNEMGPGQYNYWTIDGSYPRGGPGFFGACPIQPTATPTPSATSVTPTPTITNTPTVTQTKTPTVTPTYTPTPNVTPSPTATSGIPPTPSVTPSETPKQINFKTIANDFQRLTAAHKQLNSFGLGDINQLSYWTQFRDNVENTEYQSPYYPLLYVVPSTIENQLQYKTWNFNIMIADILERDLDNQVDISSDTLQILQDVISQFRLSVSEIQGDYYDKYYINDNVECVPFLEKMDDLLNGWSGLLKIKTMTTLNRCTAAYNVFTGTPIVHDTINFKTFHDDFRLLADHHKQLNSFGFGSKQDFTYWTESRDKQDNPHYQSPYYPLLYVIPDNVYQEFGDMRYTFNVIVADIIERDLNNQTDVLSDTNQILDDIIGQFRLSVNDALGNFNEKYYLNNPVVCRPFLEKYDDLLGGWVAKMDILVPNALDRCNAAFRPFNTPTPTKTPTQTPTSTQTPTPSITASETPTLTPTLTPSVTPSITQTQTPTETSTQTPTPSITASETPTNTPSETPTNTPTLTPSITSSQTPTVTETPTNTPTITASNTPTVTSTPTNTLTPSITPSPTLTQTPTSTQEPICPEQLFLTGGTGTTAYHGTYDRLYSTTGGTNFNTAWYSGVWNFDTLDPSGRTGVAYGRQSGSTYYTIFVRSIAGTIAPTYLVTTTTGSYAVSQTGFGLGLTMISAGLVGNVYYPNRGTGSNQFYVAYPEICPTPTQTPSATRTPTPSITATQTGTPANTPTPTSTGVSTQLWNTNSDLWNNENQQWNLI